MNELNIILTLRFRHSPYHPKSSRKFAVPCARPTQISPPAPPSATSSATFHGMTPRSRRRRRISWRCQRWRGRRRAASLPTEIRKLQGIVETSSAHEVQVPFWENSWFLLPFFGVLLMFDGFFDSMCCICLLVFVLLGGYNGECDVFIGWLLSKGQIYVVFVFRTQ